MRGDRLVSLEWRAQGRRAHEHVDRFHDWMSAFAKLTPEDQWRQLDPGGTPFQRQVWRALLDIPVGTVTSYGQLAAAIGRPSAARAVGGAVGANPVAILIPCHRVVASGGGPGGYRWGLFRKRILLEAERAPGFTLSDHFQ